MMILSANCVIYHIFPAIVFTVSNEYQSFCQIQIEYQNIKLFGNHCSGIFVQTFLKRFMTVYMGGGLLSPKSYVDVPARPRKSDFLYTNFIPNFPTISIPFSED